MWYDTDLPQVRKEKTSIKYHSLEEYASKPTNILAEKLGMLILGCALCIVIADFLAVFILKILPRKSIVKLLTANGSNLRMHGSKRMYTRSKTDEVLQGILEIMDKIGAEKRTDTIEIIVILQRCLNALDS